jgi:hypothetical protein
MAKERTVRENRRRIILIILALALIAGGFTTR